MVDGRDLQTLELVEATDLLGNIIDTRRGLAVIAEQQGEGVREDRAVDRLRLAAGRIDQWDLVGRRLFEQRIGRRRAVRKEKGERRAVLAGLHALIDLDGTVRAPLGLEFLVIELHTLDAAFNLVDVAEIIPLPGPPEFARRGIGADAIGRQRDVLAYFLGRGRGKAG